jgi:hypothetical protein
MKARLSIVALLVASWTAPAAASPATLPILGWTVDVDGPVEVSTETPDRAAAEDVIELTARRPPLRLAIARSDEACQAIAAPPSWAPSRWYALGTVVGGGELRYELCRDLRFGSLAVAITGGGDVDEDGRAARPLLLSLEEAARRGDASPSFAVLRAYVVGGRELVDDRGDGADRHVYVALHLWLPPRGFGGGGEGRGAAWTAALSAGRAGGGFLGDVTAGAGYATGFGPVAMAALALAGTDRIAGGFEPETSLYAGGEGYVRVELGATYAIEGAAARAWSTGPDETRAELAVLSLDRESLISLGGFYRRWDGAGTVFGVSLGLGR